MITRFGDIWDIHNWLTLFNWWKQPDARSPRTKARAAKATAPLNRRRVWSEGIMDASLVPGADVIGDNGV